jgi:hypothetical protein
MLNEKKAGMPVSQAAPAPEDCRRHVWRSTVIRSGLGFAGYCSPGLTPISARSTTATKSEPPQKSKKTAKRKLDQREMLLPPRAGAGRARPGLSRLFPRVGLCRLFLRSFLCCPLTDNRRRGGKAAS